MPVITQRKLVAVACALVASFLACSALQAADLPDGFKCDGGFIVHLGCGDGTRTVALRVNERCLVQGLEHDAAKVQQARARLLKKGVQGEVSVDHWTGDRLPYAENLINRIVVEDGVKIAEEELMRVLTPHGIAYTDAGGKWTQRVKPYPKDLDEWTHFLHGASNNAVAKDQVVGQPRRLRWVCDPLWLRSHEIPSGIQGAVSGNGRLFYFFDEGLIGITDQRIPSRYSLIARDAFNGRFLWKKKVSPWGWEQWAATGYKGKDWTETRAFRTQVPVENQRRIVVDGDRILVTLGYDAPLSILDAASGKILKTVEGTKGMAELVVDGGVAIGAIPSKGELVAVSSDHGEILWRKPAEGYVSASLAASAGRVFAVSQKGLVCLDRKNGKPFWTAKAKKPRTLVVSDGVVVVLSGMLTAIDATNGKRLWETKAVRGAYGVDLFVAQGMVWQSIQLNGENARMVGLDLRTGKKKKESAISKLVSPEHHHRCYRNKATERYIILSYEGAEFVDLVGDDHGQNNFVRGACKYGMMPCNGLLYVPADQCFCQPGSKLLGFTAIAAKAQQPVPPVADVARLTKGPAWGAKVSEEDDPGAWPTLRHDASRWGTTKAKVAAAEKVAWTVDLTGALTAPVAASGKVFVAEKDRHTLHALNATDGRKSWSFVAGGRIDSPPTIHGGLVLFGCRDGRVYCLRASDGAEVWRFLAARHDQRVGAFGQLESTWPVHGSVLVRKGIAYVVAGRSTYLDDGVFLYALDPATGKILHQTCSHGPMTEVGKNRHKAFAIPGANADLLVSEGDYIYMRQLKFTPELKEEEIPPLSPKGEKDVGLHVFSTASLLDGSWYNRAFWMYGKRWPGFQLANQAPKTGQLLVVDSENTYAVRVFYRRNVHSPMFFPGKEGYLLFADKNSNEPNLVGAEGAREPIKWLPQSDYARGRGKGLVKLNSPAFGKDKMMGFTRAEPALWQSWVKVRPRALVKAGEMLYAAGPPDLFDEKDPYAPFEGKHGAVLLSLSAKDGQPAGRMKLESPPVFDGLIAAYGSLFASLEDGRLVCIK